MSEMRIPKREIAAELLLPGGRSFAVTIFLADYVAGRTGPERPSDLLAGTETFLPALSKDSGQTTFFRRDGILGLRVAAELESTDTESEHRVELAMDDGSSLHGVLRYSLPVEHSRLFDAINQPEPFLSLFQGASVLLVNKKHISRVSPAPSSSGRD